MNEITLPDYREIAWRLFELATENRSKYAVEQIEEALKHAERVGRTLATQDIFKIEVPK